MSDCPAAGQEFNAELSLLKGQRGEVHCSPMLSRILTCLIDHADKPISHDALIAAAWPDGNPPPTARAALHVHIVHLRKLMAEVDTRMRIASGRRISVHTFYAIRYIRDGPPRRQSSRRPV